jgi:hypothetical protein
VPTLGSSPRACFSGPWFGAQPSSRPGPLACEAHNRIKEAGYRRKQEQAFGRGSSGVQPIDIPRKFVASAWRQPSGLGNPSGGPCRTRQVLGCSRICSEKSACGFERDQVAKRASYRRWLCLALARPGLTVRAKCPVVIHETARSAASRVRSARRYGFDKNTNARDNGATATSNAAPAINAAEGDPQASCRWPAAQGPTAIRT